MQREPISSRRSPLLPPRRLTGGQRIGRLLDDYNGTPHHGRTRTNVERRRPRWVDLVETADS